MAEIEMKDVEDVESEKSVRTWSTGRFQVLFLAMGQGDCCVITCPDGNHLMIDCGSKAKDYPTQMEDVRKVLRSNDVLGLPDSKQYKLEALILTHPDEDHNNKVTECLVGRGGDASIMVNRVYFSHYNRNSTDFFKSPLGVYKHGGCSDTIYNKLNVVSLHCVSLNDEHRIVENWRIKESGSDISYVGTSVIETTYVPVVPENENWGVYIIAGNVMKTDSADHSDSDGSNSASLVTLIRMQDKKILICGDATTSTEKYLIKTFDKQIENISLLQAPHHGSGVTSSSSAFVSKVKPEQVCISVRKHERKNHLPGGDPIRRYRETANVDPEPHPIQYWEKITDDKFLELKAELAKDKENYEVKSKYWLRKEYGDAYKGIVMLFGFNSSNFADKFVLYQVNEAQAIWQTGVSSHLFYYFPPFENK
jgi:beta-lactamase superfamily II metal-dependent hydrolase